MSPARSAALPCALCAIGWIVGVALQLQQSALWPGAAHLLLCAAGLLAALAGLWCRRRAGQTAPLLGTCLLICACAALAFGSTAWRAQQRLDDALPSALEGQDLLVTGVIADLPRAGLTGTRFVLDVDQALQAGKVVHVPQRLSLGWYRGGDDDAGLSGPVEALRAGQRWRFTLRLRQPHGTFNPHGFDFELLMFERGIGAVGAVRAVPQTPPVKLASDAGDVAQRLRQSVRDAIYAQVPDTASAGVLAALAIGDQAAIERDGWELFRMTGLGHLMSISGLHVTMLAWLGAAVIGRLWRWSPRLLLRCPAQQAARWGGLVVALAYAQLAGWGVPAQRTVWMIALVVLLRSSGVRWPLHAVLLAAALLVTLGDPWALLQPGFWLSFVAVALLVASEPVHAAQEQAAQEQAAQGRAPHGTAPHDHSARVQAHGWRARTRNALLGGLRTQALATVGLAPLTLVFFQQLSVVGFVANLVAIPLVTLVITPLALLGVLLPPLWLLDAAIVRVLTAWLQWLAAWPWAQWQAAVAPTWAMACGLLAGALAVLPLPWRLRLLAVPLLLPLLWPPLQRPAAGQFELVAADVGQGTAVLVRTQRHLLVFDTGPLYSADLDANAGARVLLPLLRARGETRIDVLMLSHRDADHVGGAATLLAALPVGRISSSLTDDHVLFAGQTPHSRCDAGQAWDWDGVHFELLHPLAADHADQRKANALSCVLRVSNAGGQGQGQGNGNGNGSGNESALLTGDIEAAQEAALLRRESAVGSSVLLVPHHGSRTSSTAAFIDAVAPDVAVVQAAYRSRFGHPAPDVVARYTSRGIAVVRSDSCGAWTWQSAAAPTGARCERQFAQRYWHHRPQPATSAAP